MTNINEQARIEAIKEYFTADEMAIMYHALSLAAEYHEEKAGIINKTGINTKYKSAHKNSMLMARKLAANFIG